MSLFKFEFVVDDLEHNLEIGLVQGDGGEYGIRIVFAVSRDNVTDFKKIPLKLSL